jgi:Holliday junction DNA helicase RuvB
VGAQCGDQDRHRTIADEFAEAALGFEHTGGGPSAAPWCLLRRVRDFAQVNEASVVTREAALGALELLEIDACGFDKMDRAILAAIIDKFDGGPVGVDTLAAAVGEESDAIGDVYEPYLLQEGFIARTARGRVATQRAYAHLNRTRRDTLL